MELPLLIEPLPNGAGYVARLGEPFNLTANAATAEQAHQEVANLLQARIQHGTALRSIVVPSSHASKSGNGWLPDDKITREWLQSVQQYRAECDADDQRRLLGQPVSDKAAS
jgi:hypothetical protein